MTNIHKYKISHKNYNTHKFGKEQDGGITKSMDDTCNIQTYFVVCEICNLHVFLPDIDVWFHNTFEQFEDYSCDECIIRNIIE